MHEILVVSFCPPRERRWWPHTRSGVQTWQTQTSKQKMWLAPSVSVRTHTVPLLTGDRRVWPPSPLQGCVAVSYTCLCLCRVLAIVLVGIVASCVRVYLGAHHHTGCLMDIRDLYSTPLRKDSSSKLAHQSWLNKSDLSKLTQQSWLNKAGSTKLAQQSWLNKAGAPKLAQQSWLNKAGSTKLAHQCLAFSMSKYFQFKYSVYIYIHRV